ncbi:site-2 protease family protein [Opitutus sp. GAS368]|uniref:site-2 protease family protein n=1 Tax=Opitutus sp. GAS368 TaxID=1882749 RepID=UPI0015607AC3|nr:site-2 protease family protein [Opitutus sp. GAS368]
MHASFVLLLLYAGLEGWQDDGGWTGMLISVIMVVVFFICVVLHELGHSLTARRYGIRVPRILLMPIGGMAEFERIPRQPSAEFLITIAGPLVNFAIVLVLLPFVGLPPGFPFHPVYEDSIRGLWQMLLYWNGLMGLFNLLPVFPMDGGRIFRALLASRLPYLQATWWAVMVGRVLAIGLILRNLYLENYMLAVLFTFILVAGNAEYQAALRREQEEAYWREMAREAVTVPPATDEPPLILHGPN